MEVLQDQLEVFQRIIVQSKQVVSGNRRIADRIVSHYDQDARPIKKGKLKAPTEFGYKTIIQENEDRLITGYNVYQETRRMKAYSQKPWKNMSKSVAGYLGSGNRQGFGSKANEDLCIEKGVKRISLPKKVDSVADRKQ